MPPARTACSKDSDRTRSRLQKAPGRQCGEYTEGGREYAYHYFPHDERLPRVLRLPDSRMVHVTEVYIARERKTSRTDNASLCRDDASSGLNVRLDDPAGLHIGWALADPLDPHSWGTAQLTLIERLLPYRRQFVRVRQALAAADALHALLPHLLDHALIGVFVLDRRGTIVETNTHGRRILQRAPGILPLILHISPVPHRADFGAQCIAVLVLLADPVERPRIDPVCLATTLGLTQAEGYVAAALAAGHSVRDIAVATRRTQATIRAHVRQLHHELGLPTQAVLVRLVLSTAGVPLPRA